MEEELDDKKRVKLIIKALRDCEQAVSPTAIYKQFMYETGRAPNPKLLRTTGETVSSPPD
jgi:hypothetical protein